MGLYHIDSLFHRGLLAKIHLNSYEIGLYHIDSLFYRGLFAKIHSNSYEIGLYRIDSPLKFTGVNMG